VSVFILVESYKAIYQHLKTTFITQNNPFYKFYQNHIEFTKIPFHKLNQNDIKFTKIPIRERERETKIPSRTWSSGPREESPQTSQTTLPRISPVQPLTLKTNTIINNTINSTIIFCFIASIVKTKKKNTQKTALSRITLILRLWADFDVFHRHCLSHRVQRTSLMKFFYRDKNVFLKIIRDKFGKLPSMFCPINTNQNFVAWCSVLLRRFWELKLIIRVSTFKRTKTVVNISALICKAACVLFMLIFHSF